MINFKLIALRQEKKTVFINSQVLGIDCKDPDIDLIVKIGADFEGLMAVISWMVPKGFPFQIAIPPDVFPEIIGFAGKHDISIDIVIRGVMLVWTMDYDPNGEVMFPINKFVLQQFSNATLNDNEIALLLYLSHKIEASRFKNAVEIQNIGVEVYGDDVVYIVRDPNGTIRKQIK